MLVIEVELRPRLAIKESHGGCLILTVHYCVQNPGVPELEKMKNKPVTFFLVEIKYQC